MDGGRAAGGDRESGDASPCRRAHRGLAAAGAAYAFSAATEGRYLADDPLGFWPWDKSWWKPKGARRDLIRAAALIVAEIERIDRADTLTPEAAWQDLVDKDDRTSPEEYPDMALITFEELRDYMEGRA